MPYGQCGQETPQENQEAQVSQAEKGHAAQE